MQTTETTPGADGSRVPNLLRSTKRNMVERLHALRAQRELSRAYRYDAARFYRHSSTTGPFRTRENLAAKLTERYHGIEKGLSLPHPRPAFGRDLVATVVRLAQRYESSYGSDAVTDAAWNALAAYLQMNRAAGLADGDIPSADAIQRRIQNDAVLATPRGGTIPMTAREVRESVSGVDLSFFTSRHSTRMFSDEPVARQDIEFAAAAAGSSPAVCNRQFTRIHVWDAPDDISRLLAVQGGARGFGEEIRALALVTVTQQSYWSAAERNQGWIDGGLYAMSFILGLHARTLGAVPLNWSKTPAKDMEMRELTRIADSESIIMLVGIGQLREEYRVAASPRTGPFLMFHEELPDSKRPARHDGER